MKTQKNFSIWKPYEKKVDQKRYAFLHWVKKTIDPQKIYYPGSGWDKIPKIVFGKNKIFHLSLEENKDVGGYFPRLGNSIKIQGNFLESPFRDETFDLIIIHNSPYEVTVQGLSEFYRVLKTDGLLVLDNDGWEERMINHFMQNVNKYFKKINPPAKFNDPNNSFIFIFHVDQGIIGTARSEKKADQLTKGLDPQKIIKIKQCFKLFKK